MNRPNQDFKIAVLAEGPGFFEDRALAQHLEAHGYQIHRLNFNHGRKLVAPELLAQADLLVFRGPWTLSPEEALLSRRLGRALKDSLAAGGHTGFAPHQKVIAIGRGAWMLVEAGLDPFPQKLSVCWKESFLDAGPWIDLQIPRWELEIPGLIGGRALPVFEGTSSKRLEPWLLGDKEVCGWSIDNRVFLSFVDPLACTHGNQIRHFGYSNLEKLQTRNELVEALLR